MTIPSVSSLAIYLTLFFTVVLAQEITVKDTKALLKLLSNKKLTLTPDAPLKPKKQMAPQDPIFNNTNDWTSPFVKRDTSWGSWNGLQLVIRWNTRDYTPNWTHRIRNEVADQAANRGWQAWWNWAAMNFHARYAGDLKRSPDRPFTIITPGPITNGDQINVDPNSAYTYTYDPADSALRLDTIRTAFRPTDLQSLPGRLKRQWWDMKRPSFNMAFTKMSGGGSCGADYSDFYAAAYHASFVSAGTGEQLCGFIRKCCDTGCEVMQFQASNYDQYVHDLWGQCMEVNRNAQWYNYGFW
jgi:hypothetical protein